MRVAVNLLTDDPANPSGAHWFWTHIIPEMAKMMTDDEEFHLVLREHLELAGRYPRLEAWIRRVDEHPRA